MSVTNGNNTGFGSLRYWIEDTSEPVITFDPSVLLVQLTSQLNISRQVTVISDHPVIVLATGIAEPYAILCQNDDYLRRFENIIFQSTSDVGAFRCQAFLGTSTLNLVNCTLRGFQGANTILAVGFNLDLDNCIFEQNSSDNIIQVNRVANLGFSHTANISNCTFENNDYVNALIYADSNNGTGFVDLLNIDSCIFTDNYTTGLQGTIYTSYTSGDSQITISNCTFTGNDSTATCIHCLANNTSSLSLISNKILNNVTSSTTFCGIQISRANSVPANILIDRCEIANNTTINSSGISCMLTSTVFDTLTISNTTIAENSSTGVSGIYLNGNGYNAYINNVTISDNTGNGFVSLQSDGETILRNSTILTNIVNTGNAITLFNTLVATGNGALSTASTNNLISDADGFTGILAFNNQLGTSASPLNPGVGILGNYGGVNQIRVVPLLAGSLCINAGTNDQVVSSDDARGYPYARIYNGTVDIGAYEFQPFVAPCYLGNSLIRVKDNDTEMVIQAKDVRSNKHTVYDYSSDSYVPIVCNAKVSNITKVYLIQADLLGENLPSQDLYITAGHPILIESKIVKAKDVPGAIQIDIVPSDVYSIVCKYWCPIDVNGLKVCAWSESKWDLYVKRNGLVYESL